MTLRLRPAAGRVEDIEPEWRRIYEQDVSATPFSSPDWALAWSHHLAEGARPLILLAESGSDPVGLIPLVRRRRGPFRTLEMLGEGPADYWDIVARPDAAPAVREAFVHWLGRNAGRWDALIVKGVVAASDTDRALRSGSLRFARQPPIIAPRLRLPASFDEWLAGMPSDRRSNVRRRRRRLVDAGAVIETVDPSADIEAAVRRWHELRERQWATRDVPMTPLHRTPAFRSFMTELVQRMLPAGEVAFWEVRMRGDVVASYINLADDRTLYAYLGGYDPDVSRLGIGTVMTAHAIAESIEAGRSHLDFLIGQERYKYWFEPDEERSVWFTAAGTALPRSRLALLAVDGLMATRSARERARAWRASRA
jgi:CelD/BcsL family acetyltransferase involved in cellulose biosynthesis